jgi:hypothetical protein
MVTPILVDEPIGAKLQMGTRIKIPRMGPARIWHPLFFWLHPSMSATSSATLGSGTPVSRNGGYGSRKRSIDSRDPFRKEHRAVFAVRLASGIEEPRPRGALTPRSSEWLLFALSGAGHATDSRDQETTRARKSAGMPKSSQHVDDEGRGFAPLRRWLR